MIKKLFLLTGIVTVCLAFALVSHEFFNKTKEIQKPQVLGEHDKQEVKSCGVLPPVGNVRINCPECSKPEL